MKLKNLIAVLCVCAMVFALAVPVFADEATNGNIGNSTKTDFEGTPVPDPDNLTVSVQVLTALTKLYVNPYGLPYTIKDGKIGTAPEEGQEDTRDSIKEGMTTDGWFSHTAIIKNESDGELHVIVTMTTTEQGDVKVVSYATGSGENFEPRENSLYGKLEIVSAYYDYDTNAITPRAWDGTYTVEVPVGSGQPGVAGTPVKKDTNFILNAAESADAPQYAAFRIRGSAVIGSDTSAADGDVWPNADVADVSVAFSFKPTTDDTNTGP